MALQQIEFPKRKPLQQVLQYSNLSSQVEQALQYRNQQSRESVWKDAFSLLGPRGRSRKCYPPHFLAVASGHAVSRTSSRRRGMHFCAAPSPAFGTTRCNSRRPSRDIVAGDSWGSRIHNTSMARIGRERVRGLQRTCAWGATAGVRPHWHSYALVWD